ncbi:cytochrome P450 [Phlegmacium glaucopus]|nr:cytochrome P450 [Phlegmacium glaucopus]
MTSAYPYFPAVVLVLLFAYALFKPRALAKIRGPPSPSFWLGHELELRTQSDAGDLEYQWYRKYGGAFKVLGCLGEPILYIVDPKALHYVIQAGGYDFPKPHDMTLELQALMGRGLAASPAGDIHRRQRKVMTPIFTLPQLRSYLTVFQRLSNKFIQKHLDDTQGGNQDPINIALWLPNLTLDTISECAFRFKWGAIEGKENVLTPLAATLASTVYYQPSEFETVYRSIWRHLPVNILDALHRVYPMRAFRAAYPFLSKSKALGRELLQQRILEPDGSQARDALNVLARANQSEDPTRRLDEDEVLSQIATLIFAGHETTAATMTWLLYELSRHPDQQRRLREEIKEARNKRGPGNALQLEDLDILPFFNALIKETLRLHTITICLPREAGKDDAIPLSESIMSKSGEYIQEVHVKKGQRIILQVSAYQRLPEVWGEDADLWNPERFLDSKDDSKNKLGLIGNLLTFSGGIRGCIGWRFAVLQIQGVIAELIQKLEFSLPVEPIDIVGAPIGLTDVTPMIRGQPEKGTSQLPLRVTAVQDD